MKQVFLLISFMYLLVACKKDDKVYPIKTYLIESNEQITKMDNNWTDYLTKEIQIVKGNKSVHISLDMSATGVEGTPEIAFRAKVGTQYSNPSLVKWVTYNALEKPHAEFLIENVAAGKYDIGIQWKAITGSITTSQFHQSDSYNRVFIVEYPRN
ncbi:hypothetical protein [Adhaeribacter aerolatus]|nr:hypothetical protein [Adhaeribacter aerolatus]